MSSYNNLTFLFFVITAFVTITLDECDGLSNVHVTVPQYKLRGEIAFLQCDYDLDEDKLYSVKWYKDDEELYRYMPRADPPQHSYTIDATRVDHHTSDSKKLVLRPVSLRSSGVYRCEVSAEAPSFASAQSEARMQVVYLPKDDPMISGEQLQYQIGDEMSLNCTSGKSYPASVLHWYINDQKVESPLQLVKYPPQVHPHGLMTSWLGLHFIVGAHHFMDGSMKVRCIAVVSPVLWQGDRESVVQRMTPALIDNREALLLVKASSEKRHANIKLAVLAVLFAANLI
ncbi:uncharacterized protein LOC123297355 [Chrysoperla carnea]|uniref:uncharacterized protein LOC123297355 n=1 Tax=Chrysoperla carnea TaxID=189513 RepID=UPI001D0616B9|nr:uncharacterized protein LOC123297355 [Chrysoperla carnea]